MSVAETTSDDRNIPVLLFISDGRRYGVPLTRVREVVEIEKMEPIEGEAADYIGVMVLRDEPIPLVVVRHRSGESEVRAPELLETGAEPAPQGVARRGPVLPMCIVLQRGHAVIGLAVERILGIRQFGPARAVRGLVATDEPQHAYLDEAGDLVQSVDADRWFNAQTTLPLLADQRSVAEAVDDGEAVRAEERRFMAVGIGEQLFAIDSTLVERAIDDTGVAPLPRRPGVRVRSVIEVSGNVLPVLRLTEEDLAGQPIHVIVNYYDQKWAIATERVLGIVTDESPGAGGEDEVQSRVISSKGAFHEVIDLQGLIAAQVPDFVRSGGPGG